MTENRQIDIDEYIKACSHDIQCTRKMDSNDTKYWGNRNWCRTPSKTDRESEKQKNRKIEIHEEFWVNRKSHLISYNIVFGAHFTCIHDAFCQSEFLRSNDMQIENENKMHSKCSTFDALNSIHSHSVRSQALRKIAKMYRLFYILNK